MISDKLNFQFNPADYDDEKDSRKRIDTLFNQFNNNLISLGIDYANYMSGTLVNDRLYQIRNSILTRCYAALFHNDLLSDLNVSGRKRAIPPNILQVDGMRLVQRQDFLFDSIIFHLVSSMDYFSCIVKINTVGNISNWKATWTKLRRKLQSDQKFSKEALVLNYIEVDNLLFGKLNEYRADLIHYSKDGSQHSTTLYTGLGMVKIEASVPWNFYRTFKKLLILENSDSLNLNSACFWIIEKVLESLNFLTLELRIYLKDKRVRPEGTEVIRTLDEK